VFNRNRTLNRDIADLVRQATRQRVPDQQPKPGKPMRTHPLKDEVRRSQKTTVPIPVTEFLAKPPVKPHPIIPGLLRVGVTVLVDGTGQAGRSLALDLAIAVATGDPVLQRKPVHTGAVLYLFPSRHRLNLRHQLHQAAQSTSTLAKAPLAVAPIQAWSDAAYALIQRWASKAKNPRLVVIDGLMSHDLDTYAAALGRLARLARRLDVAVLVVVSRILPPDNWARPWVWLASHPVLAGVMCLAPTHQSGKAQLTAVNHHSPQEKHWDLQRHPATGQYVLAGSTSSSQLSPERQAILNLLGQKKRLTTRQIAKQLGRPKEATRRLLHTMTLKGQVSVDKSQRPTVYLLPR
jgi:hypothetical protein